MGGVGSRANVWHRVKSRVYNSVIRLTYSTYLHLQVSQKNHTKQFLGGKMPASLERRGAHTPSKGYATVVPVPL